MRDALLGEVVRGYLPNTAEKDPKAFAHQAFTIVDALMAERQKRVVRCLAEIEAWGRERLHSEGIALISNVDVILTAMIHRFGGSIEIPFTELKVADEACAYIDITEDKERGVLTARPVAPPRDPMRTVVS